MHGDRYQIALILSGFLVTLFFAIFLMRELFPEYRLYQNAYIELEKFRSTYTHEPPPPFQEGIKQILIERADKGPPTVDRCICCHIALQLPNFSPTKLGADVNGELLLDDRAIPIQVPNENYIWGKLDERVHAVEKDDPHEAARLTALKTAQAGDHRYDMTKVLAMHPLIGRETRPFEYHPIDEYGCTSCHSGNGRGLTTEKAHGPVFDGQYQVEFEGPKPQFLEPDPLHDPPFAHIFNHKPGEELLFQTTPILVGSLIQARCVDCHLSSEGRWQEASRHALTAALQQEKLIDSVETGYSRENANLASLKALTDRLETDGFQQTLVNLEKKSIDYSLLPEPLKMARAQYDWFRKLEPELASTALKQEIDAAQTRLADKAHSAGQEKQKKLFSQQAASSLTQGKKQAAMLKTEVDQLIQNYQRGRELFLNQACYACHRISGLSRGGVGPELTNAGSLYPWYLKQKIVWPQSTLKTSTMPNYHLDHAELEDLVTYLLGQNGKGKSRSEAGYRSMILEWEAGKKLPWEEPINPAKLHDLHYAMTIFATEGCAACHRLKGYVSNVGYRIEKGAQDQVTFEQHYAESQWFQQLVPENIFGSQLVRLLEKHSAEIDQHISDHVREGSLLEEFDTQAPGLVESFYPSFRYASRAHEETSWKQRVKRLLMIFVQEYGLGRLIGPRPNWSGIYRSDEWLIEHFRKPSQHTARSIMPVFPFDDSKFYALTSMLDTLAKQNRQALHQIWRERGFDPEQAYQTLCSQCHGQFLHGDGPVAEWIYPIPKNLRNVDFLSNISKDNVMQSITHGVKGTPMPPWGETGHDKQGSPVLSQTEITQLVNWLYASLLGVREIKSYSEIPKWRYHIQDLEAELKTEGNRLPSGPPLPFSALEESKQEPAPAGQPVSREEPIFTSSPNPEPGPEKILYYIKKEYYTEPNIRAGQEFFEVNCAVCHGKEADGQGYRAGSMFDAKPRMLTNLHWIDTRDDLRLLRSIKYGVPGTSMTPWGDLTSALQRLQLVIYIRSLNEEQSLRDTLFNTIYQSFDESKKAIGDARAAEYAAIDQLQQQLEAVKTHLSAIVSLGQENEQAIALFRQQLEISEKLREHRLADKLLIDLQHAVEREAGSYQELGIDLIRNVAIDEEGILFSKLIELLRKGYPLFTLTDHQLAFSLSPEKTKKMEQIADEMMVQLAKEEGRIEQKRARAIGQPSSTERTQKLALLGSQLKVLSNLKQAMTATAAETKQWRGKQQEFFQKLSNETSKSNELKK